ncbi:DUF1819 family protein [Bacillus cytotoxicus]|uniref:BREX-1 system RNA-binding protein BrxA n=1 Tax=Bacillus cereus group sp. BfR-BA-01492 TaxID=2920361 RepID=UPI0024127598|nr:DUF1819 family protein [Bacillus cereus group sp. BfR-BA-01492]EMA6342979.1 DUF1819 family protein [Bacillus cytotoxicus]
MVKKQEYKSTIKSRPFLFLETKKVSSLLLQGLKEFEVKEKAVVENIFQVNTESRKKELASIILARLKVLDEYLIQKIVHGDIESSKTIVLYAILKTDRLFFEFMNEVFKEKFIFRETYITDADFNVFFEHKQQQSEKIASWNEYTFYKLKQVYIRILFEAGFLKNQKGDREVERPLLDADIVRYIRELGDGIYMDILVGE